MNIDLRFGQTHDQLEQAKISARKEYFKVNELRESYRQSKVQDNSLIRTHREMQKKMEKELEERKERIDAKKKARDDKYGKGWEFAA